MLPLQCNIVVAPLAPELCHCFVMHVGHEDAEVDGSKGPSKRLKVI